MVTTEARGRGLSLRAARRKSSPDMRALAILLFAASAVAAEGPCVGSGSPALRDGRIVISEPTTRIQWREQAGTYAGAVIEYRGPTEKTALAASGSVLRQYGLNLRSPDQCNVLYVMRPVAGGRMVVSVKRNPGQTTHQQCGARGYSLVQSSESAEIAPLALGAREWLEATIEQDRLRVLLDGALVWEGAVPPMRGSAGFRADNTALYLHWLSGPSGTRTPQWTCGRLLP